MVGGRVSGYKVKAKGGPLLIFFSETVRDSQTEQPNGKAMGEEAPAPSAPPPLATPLPPFSRIWSGSLGLGTATVHMHKAVYSYA